MLFLLFQHARTHARTYAKTVTSRNSDFPNMEVIQLSQIGGVVSPPSSTIPEENN